MAHSIRDASAIPTTRVSRKPLTIYRIRYETDRYACQDINTAQEYLRSRVFQSFADSPAGHILALAEVLDPIAPGMVVSSDAIDGGAMRPNRAEWARFVEACRALPGNLAQSA